MLSRYVDNYPSTPHNITEERRSQTFCSLHLDFMYGGFLQVTAIWQHVSRFRVMMCVRRCTRHEGNCYKKTALNFPAL